MIMDRLYGGVCYAGIDTDPELKYPKGAGRVAFSNQQSYIAAISARFVQLQHNDIDKRVSPPSCAAFGGVGLVPIDNRGLLNYIVSAGPLQTGYFRQLAAAGRIITGTDWSSARKWGRGRPPRLSYQHQSPART